MAFLMRAARSIDSERQDPGGETAGGAWRAPQNGAPGPANPHPATPSAATGRRIFAHQAAPPRGRSQSKLLSFCARAPVRARAAQARARPAATGGESYALHQQSGTGHCEHGRQIRDNKHQCKQCGTGHCEHGRRKQRCTSSAAPAHHQPRLESGVATADREAAIAYFGGGAGGASGPIVGGGTTGGASGASGPVVGGTGGAGCEKRGPPSKVPWVCRACTFANHKPLLSSSLWDVFEYAELIAEKRELSCAVQHQQHAQQLEYQVARTSSRHLAGARRTPGGRWHPTARRFVCWHQAPGGVQGVVRTNGASPPQKSIRSTARGGGLLCEPKPTSPQTSSPQLELCNARSAGRGARSFSD
jgi:hypothetical protein